MNYSEELKKIGFKFSNGAKRNKKKWKTSSVPKNFKSFGFDFFDNNKISIGYKGYYYNKRYFFEVSKNLIKKFKLKNNSKILELGCAKGCFLFDLYQNGMDVKGVDISFYAKNKSVPQIKNKIILDKNFIKNNKKYDLIIALNVLCYFKYSKIDKIIELIRDSSKNFFIIIETISNINQKKKFLNSDPNFIIAETSDWWITKLKKYNMCMNNIYFRNLI